jgi:phage head maturation protease
VPKKQAPQMGIQQERQTVSLAVREINKDERRVSVSFSSEKAVTRWYGQEVLSHDENCIDLTRLNEIGVALFNHDRSYVIGRVENAKLDSVNKRCTADLIFDDDAQADLIFRKVESGTLKGTSFGYGVDVWEEIAAGKTSSNGRFMGPAYVATKWYPYEISIVSVPADETVGVGREMEVIDNEENNNSREENNMPKGAPNPGTNPQSGEIDVNAERELAITNERQRVSEITSICREFTNLEIDIRKHIDNGDSVDTVRAAILDKMRGNNATGVPNNTPTVEIIAEERDKFREAASDSVLLRSGIKIEKAAEGARDLRGLSLRELAIESLRMDGKRDASRMPNDQLFREALSGAGAFSAILDNTVNKSMKHAYNAQATSYKIWTSEGSNPDFKPTKKYQISEAGDLDLIPESGEFKHDEMKDEAVSCSLLTYGKIFSLSRQALINDDISILTKLPASYVRAAMRGINRGCYKALGSNPAIYDGVSLFHANHGNLAGTAAAIGVASVGAGRSAMRKQKNLRGNEILNITPKFMLVPSSLETDAEKFLGSTSDPAANNSGVVNPFSNKLQIVADAELDAYGVTPWYLAADPTGCDTIEVTYLNGSDMPTLESAVLFDQLGMKWRIFIDYGITVIDYRGLYKNAGV